MTESAIEEPMLGLSKLIEGSCYNNLGKVEESITCYRQCLKQRQNLPNNGDGTHVSACAQYELGALLVRQEEVPLTLLKLTKLN